MKKNVGTVDQWIRIVLGIVLLALVFIIQGDWRWIGLVGLIPLATGISGVCPLYALFGISTNKAKDSGKTGK
ncbi:MAG: DUF2892 domain-containing protein [Clostridiales bacterium]|nr:DUF2892 domain-containing protein [Clostridiales bacterium]